MLKKKPEIWWCIKTRGILLPFTARITKKQAIEDRLAAIGYDDLRFWESCVKIQVIEVPGKKKK